MKPDSVKSLLRKNLKDQPAFRPSQYWLARITPRVLQWDVLCGIPYRGRRGTCLALPNEPSSSLPKRAGSQATLEDPLLLSNFLRVSLLSLICKPVSKSYWPH